MPRVKPHVVLLTGLVLGGLLILRLGDLEVDDPVGAHDLVLEVSGLGGAPAVGEGTRRPGPTQRGEDPSRREALDPTVETPRPAIEEDEIATKGGQTTRFRLLDDRTGRPVEYFRLVIERGRGARCFRENGSLPLSGNSRTPDPTPERHPGGEVELPTRPGFDRYALDAPDYLSRYGEIVHETPGSNLQVIRLGSGAGVRARVLESRSPVAGVRVRLDQLLPRNPMSLRAPCYGHGALGKPPPTELVFRPLDGCGEWCRTGADGRVGIGGLRAGTYRLELHHEVGGSVRSVPFELGLDQEVDLGDLFLGPSSTITGRVLVPTGRSPAGLAVMLDGPAAWRRAKTDAAGRFVFEDVVPGDHELQFRGVRRRYTESERVLVHVEPGAAREVVLDLRSRGLCELALTCQLGIESTRSLGVFLVPLAEPQMRLPLGWAEPGKVLRRWVRAMGDAFVEVETLSGVVIRHPTAVIPLALDTSITWELHIPAGALELTFSSPIELPEHGLVRLRLESSNRWTVGSAQVLEFSYSRGLQNSSPPSCVNDQEGELRLAPVPEGSYRLSLEVFASRLSSLSPSEQVALLVELGPGADPCEREPVLRKSRTVAFQDGEVTEVDL